MCFVVNRKCIATYTDLFYQNGLVMDLICCLVFLNELNDMFNEKAIIFATYTQTCLNIITIRQEQVELPHCVV